VGYLSMPFCTIPLAFEHRAACPRARRPAPPARAAGTAASCAARHPTSARSPRRYSLNRNVDSRPPAPLCGAPRPAAAADRRAPCAPPRRAATTRVVHHCTLPLASPGARSAPRRRPFHACHRSAAGEIVKGHHPLGSVAGQENPKHGRGVGPGTAREVQRSIGGGRAARG
jgi:hypothetical protein